MVRFVTQILVGLMLFFGVATLFPKAYFDYRRGHRVSAIKYAILGILALYFAGMAFYYAYLLMAVKT